MNLKVLADWIVWRAHLRPYRAGHWWRFKIPPSLCAAMGFWLLLDFSPGGGMALAAVAVACLSCAAAFGHAVNEWADRAQDALAGRPNTMAPLGPVARFLSPAVPLAGAFVLALAASAGPLAVALLALEFVLAAAYSLPPVRAKERGAWGVAVEGASTLAVPGLFIAALFFRHAPAAPLAALAFAGTWTVLGLALGIKGILWHQDLDRGADRTAGVRTYGASRTHEEIRRILIRRVYPVEMAALAMVVVILTPAAPLVALFYLLHGLMEAGKVAIDWRVMVGAGQARYLPFINNFFYELALPLALSFSMVRGLFSLLFPVVLILIFYPNIPQQVSEYVRFDKAFRKEVNRIIRDWRGY